MATGRLVQKDWYSMLGAKSTDSLTELKQKYQKLAIKYHPDKQSADVPAGELEERVQRFIEIDQAWKILGNEETKKEYDLQQRESELTHYWPIDAHVHLEDMSWDSVEECYSSVCRCGGKYTLSKNETEDVSLVCCNTCSLIIEIIKDS
ncbi:dnaJ homolog subfamily C member 24 isoform X2 [Ambystoma mexicanum]|uniref:dnaJ homolog subfamily C member 24 isoform X2 n=1 Tax=Ambystoma mexicanum TaxID=8296 RepID=UPI0037E7B85D